MERFWDRENKSMNDGRGTRGGLPRRLCRLAMTGWLLFAVLFAACSMGELDSKSDVVGQQAVGSEQYGSLTICKNEKDAAINDNARALKIDDITKADISVVGYGMSMRSKQDANVSSGVVSSVTIDNIKVGPNRAVRMEGKENIENVVTKMAGVEMFAVKDIVKGSNSVSVNWSSTALGKIYYKLIELNYDVSTLSLSQVTPLIPDVHATLVNVDGIANDIKTGSTKDANAYKLSPANVIINSDIEAENITLQVSDPSSSKLTSLSKTQTISNVSPGTWKVYIIETSTDGSPAILYNGAVTVGAGETKTVSVTLKTPSPRLEDANGSGISAGAMKKGDTKKVYLGARTVDGETQMSGVTIRYNKTTDGSEPAVPTKTSGTEYTSGGIDVGVDASGNPTKIKAVAFKNGLKDSDVVSFVWVKQKLGETHPATGQYSPVDSASWATAHYPLGSHVVGGDTTFALYSAHATKVLLEIYTVNYGQEAAYDYWMTKGSDNIWRAKVSGVGAGTLYAFRCWGPNWTYTTDAAGEAKWDRGNSSEGFVKDCDTNGNRFNPNKVLFDPYTREMSHDKETPSVMTSQNVDGGIYGTGSESVTYPKTGGATGARRIFDTGKVAPKSVVVNDTTSFGAKPQIPAEKAIIYEAHARGLTKHPSTANLTTILQGMEGFEGVQNVPENLRGTYAGAALMVPYLKALGVNTIELLPVHESDNDKNSDSAPAAGGKLEGNYWAYMTYGYFAPDRRYSSDKSLGGPTREFKAMVKAFHDAEMEVYLDVVYNHTGEGGTWDGTGDVVELTSMHGIDNSTYFELCGTDNNFYYAHTGCGNDLQCDNAIVRQFILDSLTYWTDEMGVDGFRFDLAPVLGHVKNGENWSFNSNAKTLTDIATIGKTKNVEMIAEAWDAGGCQCVGQFPNGWGEWNGRYRDAIRGFVGTGTRGNANDFINGDYNNFNDQGGSKRTVNFIVAHDGFTLADLSTYGGVGNASNSTLAWPFGPSDGGNGDNNSVPDSTSEGKRQTHRNYMALQAISRGVPMIVWGDEFGRTQNGNNNPYNVDSVATWNNYNMINTKSPHTVATGGTGAAYHNNFGTFGKTQAGTDINTETPYPATNINGNFVLQKYLLNMKQNEPAFNTGDYTPTYSWFKEDGTTAISNDSENCEQIYIAGSSISGGSDYVVFVNLYNAPDNKFTIPNAPSGKVWKRLVDTQKWFEVDYNCWDEDDAWEMQAGSTYGCGARSIVILKACTPKPKCATPVITGTDNFTGSTPVTISCETSGADIYYTTDNSAPTKTSNKYSAPFTISATTTIRAIAIKAGSTSSDVATKKLWLSGTKPTVDASGVMLQGFNWSSAKRGDKGKGENYSTQNPSPNWYKWYQIMTARGGDIGSKFEYVWCPPPSKTDTASSEGYAPTELNDLNNCYGTEAQLDAMISAISPAKPIADIVVNHRAGSTCWGDFTNPSWGVVKSQNYKAICSDDEGFSGDTHMTTVSSNMRGAPDTGEGYSSYRDIDHTNTTVQNGIITWMNDVLKPKGFVGWRYDYVKGYAGRYVGQYDAATNAEFSVGEYWPTAGYSTSNPGVWGNEIKGWIRETEQGGYRSKAFDFALKGAMNHGFGSNYALLGNSANLIISQPEDAVTFVDNHDTGSSQSHWPLGQQYIGAAYALILTHGGYPCVAWQHYFTANESKLSSDTSAVDPGQYIGGSTVPGTTNTYRQHIDYLIDLRKRIGIEYDDKPTNVKATSGYYAGTITGNNGELTVVIGNGYTPTGTGYIENNPIYGGTNFKIWEKNVNGTYTGSGSGSGGGTSGGTVTVTVNTSQDWIWNSCSMFAWVWTNGSNPSDGEWIQISKGSSSATNVICSLPQAKNRFLLVRCPTSTTTPNWNATGDNAGRIYNKTADLTYTGTQTVSATFVNNP